MDNYVGSNNVVSWNINLIGFNFVRGKNKKSQKRRDNGKIYVVIRHCGFSKCAELLLEHVGAFFTIGQ